MAWLLINELLDLRRFYVSFSLYDFVICRDSVNDPIYLFFSIILVSRLAIFSENDAFLAYCLNASYLYFYTFFFSHYKSSRSLSSFLLCLLTVFFSYPIMN